MREDGAGFEDLSEGELGLFEENICDEVDGIPCDIPFVDDELGAVVYEDFLDDVDEERLDLMLVEQVLGASISTAEEIEATDAFGGGASLEV